MLLLTGAPGAGKSTVARILARCFDRAAHLDVDWVLHHLTVSGLAPPDEQTAEADRQVNLALRNVAALASNFHDDGFFAVVEGAVASRENVSLLRSQLAPRRLVVAVLSPAKEVSEERDRLRGGKQVAHLFSHLHDQIAAEVSSDADIRIDSAGQDPSTTATLLLSLLLRATEERP